MYLTVLKRFKDESVSTICWSLTEQKRMCAIYYIAFKYEGLCLTNVLLTLFLWQMWVLLVFSILAGFLGIAAASGLSYSLVKAIILRKERVLKKFCKFFDETPDPATITNECPFDPTRIYVGTIFTQVWSVTLYIEMKLVCKKCCLVCKLR